MNATAWCTVNSPDVVHEIIDGEAVIINLQTGSYYSIDQVGAEIWSLLANGAAASEVVEGIAERFSGEREQIEGGVFKLLDQLQSEGLIRTEDRGDAAPNGAHANGSFMRSLDSGPFSEPMLHKYTDMEELLLLDPIHDVDESGWPTLKPQ
jgi:hypothetical protein